MVAGVKIDIILCRYVKLGMECEFDGRAKLQL